jgi:hypothetical protein
MLNEIEHYQSKLQAHLALKKESETQAGLMTEILNGHISSVYVDKKQAKHFLDIHRKHIAWNTHQILGIQAILSVLIKASEGQADQKVSA